MKQALENATDEDREDVRRMLSDLNDLLAAHRRGEDTTEQFREFMEQHGDYFPDNPQSVEELVDSLAQRAAAAQRMLNSMTPEQRAELMELSAQAFGSPELMDALGDLDANLQALRPGEDWSGSEQFEGSQGLGLGDGTGALQDLAALDQLSEQLSQSYPGARMDDIDVDALARLVGDAAAVDAQTLSRLERALRDSGYLNRTSDGQLRLSPKAMRQLGRALLRDVAQRLSTPSRGTSPARSPTPSSARPRREAAWAAARAPGVPAPAAVGHPAYASTSATSRSPRRRRAHRRRWPSWWTRRSRWRWTGGGCR
jgi:uncharacterized protein with von Willebrand factor type A (vWA) domain